MHAPSVDPRLARVRALARVLDSAVAVPGTNFRFGLDPVLGLVPGLGDLAGAMLSTYIVLTGIRLGASRSVVVRMIANVAIDTVVGSVPVVGDLFDASWKANNRNVALIERHVDGSDATRRSSRLLILAVVVALLIIGAFGIVVGLVVIRWVLMQLHA